METDIFISLFIASKYAAGLFQLAIIMAALWIFRKKYLWYYVAYLAIPLLKPALNSYMTHLSKSIGPDELLPIFKAANSVLFTLMNVAFILGSIFLLIDFLRIRKQRRFQPSPPPYSSPAAGSESGEA
jgi:hypothetical protein